MITIKKGATVGEALDPAMTISTKREADEYLEALVKRTMEDEPSLTREAALSRCRENLGYWAGYYSNETRERVEELFECAHPVFGKIKENGPPTPQEALNKGKELGEKWRREHADK